MPEYRQTVALKGKESREIAFKCSPPLSQDDIVGCRWAEGTMLQIIAWANRLDSVVVRLENPYSVPCTGELVCTYADRAVIQ